MMWLKLSGFSVSLAELRKAARDVKFLNLNFTDHSIKAVNKKGIDQTVQMTRLICAFVVCIKQKA